MGLSFAETAGLGVDSLSILFIHRSSQKPDLFPWVLGWFPEKTRISGKNEMEGTPRTYLHTYHPELTTAPQIPLPTRLVGRLWSGTPRKGSPGRAAGATDFCSTDSQSPES